MYTVLDTVKLKTGEPMEIGLVLTPDEANRHGVIPLLGHKGQPWEMHIRASFDGPLDELETRYYIGKIHGTPIANVMTIEHNGIGILGHVFTLPEHRRKGACQLIMERQMNDFRSRGGRCLYLGTGYDTPPYWIYHGFGFRSVYEGTGFMVYTTSPEFFDQHFAPQPVHVEDLRWQHWATTTPLTGALVPQILRNHMLGIIGPTIFEEPFLRLYLRLREDQTAQAKLVVSSSGAVVGLSTLLADERWDRKLACLDLFIHPKFHDQVDQVLAALDFSACAGCAKVLCYVDSAAEYAIEPLASLGFEQGGRLPQPLEFQGQTVDVLIMSLRL